MCLHYMLYTHMDAHRCTYMDIPQTFFMRLYLFTAQTVISVDDQLCPSCSSCISCTYSTFPGWIDASKGQMDSRISYLTHTGLMHEIMEHVFMSTTYAQAEYTISVFR